MLGRSMTGSAPNLLCFGTFPAKEKAMQPHVEFPPFQGDLRVRGILEKLPAAAYTCDTEGLITYFNQRAVKLWGREPKLNNPVDRY
jgi:PAS domain-containing protein